MQKWGEKNDLSLQVSSPTQYGGPQMFFEKKILNDPGAISMS